MISDKDFDFTNPAPVPVDRIFLFLRQIALLLLRMLRALHPVDLPIPQWQSDLRPTNRASRLRRRTVIDSLISDKDFDFTNPAPVPVDMRVLRDTTTRAYAQEKNAEPYDFFPDVSAHCIKRVVLRNIDRGFYVLFPK